ncbi:MAG: hypothetical protein ACOYN6_01855 [Ignavibacteria bacterium]
MDTVYSIVIKDVSSDLWIEYLKYSSPFILFLLGLFANYLIKRNSAKKLKKNYFILINELIINLSTENTNIENFILELNNPEIELFHYTKNTLIDNNVFDKLPSTELFKSFNSYIYPWQKDRSIMDYVAIQNHLNCIINNRNLRDVLYEKFMTKFEDFGKSWNEQNYLLNEELTTMDQNYASVQLIGKEKEMYEKIIELRIKQNKSHDIDSWRIHKYTTLGIIPLIDITRTYLSNQNYSKIILAASNCVMYEENLRLLRGNYIADFRRTIDLTNNSIAELRKVVPM